MAYDSKFKRDDIDELFDGVLTLKDREDCYRGERRPFSISCGENTTAAAPYRQRPTSSTSPLISKTQNR